MLLPQARRFPSTTVLEMRLEHRRAILSLLVTRRRPESTERLLRVSRTGSEEDLLGVNLKPGLSEVFGKNASGGDKVGRRTTCVKHVVSLCTRNVYGMV